ncbi:Ankyrin repeat protein 1 [Giardia muris]|uniref:Ankyrin repeat protein 1 n=1 Tax=Giardia muris TaxID=5742 RepID=A0A4Z1T0H8_GIAMU|nr:Ankyrin repeat protein 1 [Giardia muris]|eukprot:TNJ26417.1 Ankyrin repeat protein 1 [Giardia muris]
MELEYPTSWFSCIKRREYDLARANAKKFAKTRNEKGFTGLMLAAVDDDDSMVRILAPHESGEREERGYTALMLAAELNHAAICRRLVTTEGAVTDDEKHTALMVAAMHGAYEAVLVLTPYQKGQVDVRGRNALFYAAENGHTTVVKFLMSREPNDACATGESPISIAAENGHADVVAVLAQIDRCNSASLTQSLTTLSTVMSQSGQGNQYEPGSLVKAIDVARMTMQNFGMENAKMVTTKYEKELLEKLVMYETRLNATNSHAQVMIGESAALRGRVKELEEQLAKSKEQIQKLECDLADCQAQLRDKVEHQQLEESMRDLTLSVAK